MKTKMKLEEFELIHSDYWTSYLYLSGFMKNNSYLVKKYNTKCNEIQDISYPVIIKRRQKNLNISHYVETKEELSQISKNGLEHFVFEKPVNEERIIKAVFVKDRLYTYRNHSIIIVNQEILEELYYLKDDIREICEIEILPFNLIEKNNNTYIYDLDLSEYESSEIESIFKIKLI